DVSPAGMLRVIRTSLEPRSSRLARGNYASKSARCLRRWAHTAAGVGGREQQWRLWRVGQSSRSRRSGRSFVIENTPGSGRVRRGDSRCADGKKLGPFVLGTFRGRILNTHPALLPRFGGRGMYRDRVFEAVLA